MDMIPKNIIFTVVDTVPEKFIPFVESFKNFNPDYTIMIFNNEQQDEFVKAHYPELYAKAFSRLPKLIQRSDFFRLCAIHHYGGIYCDIDIECTASLDDLLDKTLFYTVEEEITLARFYREKARGRYVRLEYDKPTFERYGNYAFGAEKGHPFMMLAANDIADEIDWIISSEHELTEEKYQYENWIYNTTATDRINRSIHTHQPADLFGVKFPGQEVNDNIKMKYPLNFGKYGIHWCNGIWKKNMESNKDFV
jgi:hypothetical protein